MKRGLFLLGLVLVEFSGVSQPRISSYTRAGDFTISDTFTNGVCIMRCSEKVDGVYKAVRNIFTTGTVAQVSLDLPDATRFYKAQLLTLATNSPRTGFTNLAYAYGTLTTIAGAGGVQDVNNWRPEFEGGPATSAVLSSPHIAVANREGEIFVADKDAHGVRKIRLDGTIVTAAGISAAGDGPDYETNATQCALNQPNGLWIKKDGTLFILDLGNFKIRRLATNGMITTLFTVSTNDPIQRGLWVSEDETVAYVTTFTTVKKWVAGEGVTDFSTNYVQCGNIVMDPGGNLVVTDRMAHRVYRLDSQGNRTVIAGNGTATGGGDGQLAINTGLEEVRGVWFLPSGAYFLCTHSSSRVWYVDTRGFIFLFLYGSKNGSHAGDGTWFYKPSEQRVSECRAITMDCEGNLLIVENDAGFIRKVRFLPHEP